jgi:hypothetical protein
MLGIDIAFGREGRAGNESDQDMQIGGTCRQQRQYRQQHPRRNAPTPRPVQAQTMLTALT